MQTFLPLPSFEGSARCLDWQRLGKQRAEAKRRDCEQKKCPPGLKPYMGAYDAKCLCIKEAE